VKRVIARHESGGGPPARTPRGRNYDAVIELVTRRWSARGAGSPRNACCPAARAAGYEGRHATSGGWSRPGKRCGAMIITAVDGRRCGPLGEHLVIDWGVLGGLHVFCAVLAWSRVRFVRFADNERADTTLALLAECFEQMGGVPAVMLADRMGA